MDELEFEHHLTSHRCPQCGCLLWQVDNTSMVVCHNTDCRKCLDNEPMWLIVVEQAR